MLLPSLDDKVVPIVVGLDRQKDFAVSHIFMGPFSSINCIKFNPNLFRMYDKETDKECIINVFAMGDNDGNLSLWGIGDGFQQKKPFFLFKSHPNGNEMIEEISWNARGNMLTATTMKKYLFIALFGDKVFGQELNSNEK